jgi:uncharacterized protein (DUF3820 family)
MIKPLFLFEEHSSYFKVVVKNLEKLSVAQIQDIESFVKQRRGIFDFSDYSFSIQKRLSYNAFILLMKESDLDVVIEEKPLEPTQQQPRVGFGQYKGLFYSDLPDSYILWLKTNYKGYDREKVEAELQRRGL